VPLLLLGLISAATAMRTIARSDGSHPALTLAPRLATSSYAINCGTGNEGLGILPDPVLH
jgi:hypothetical protein